MTDSDHEKSTRKAKEPTLVRVSIDSPLQGHTFRVPFADEDGQPTGEYLTVTQAGVLVDPSEVDAITQAAARSGILVKVDEQ